MLIRGSRGGWIDKVPELKTDLKNNTSSISSWNGMMRIEILELGK